MAPNPEKPISDNPENVQSRNKFGEAGALPRDSFVREILFFLRENKKWWLLPIIIVFVLFGFLVIFGSSAAPFIYSLF